MAQSYKVAAMLMGIVIEGSAAKLCAQGAGVGLLAHVEHYFAYVSFKYFKGDAYGFSIFRNRCIVLIRYSKVQQYRHKLIGYLGKHLIQFKAVHQKQAVLSSGHSYAYFISGTYHVIAFIGAAYTAQYSFHLIPRIVY